MATSCSVPVCSQAPLGQSCCCCKRCSMGGCDLKVLDCGCCFHTRCFALTEGMPFHSCPLCHKNASRILLLPMTFAEIDQAQAEAANSSLSDKRGKKRKNATISRLNSMETDGSELRIGRWTVEETAYCDKLIEHFERGALPIPDGVKLNDFLSSMLKSKQSRLTKKMKNAKLSSKQYKKVLGYILRDEDAREFSILETEFYASIRCNMERSEIRFHMQKEWREAFSTYCLNIGHTIDANEWLQSAEELDRRNTMQKNAARLARRKVMMGQALSEDAVNRAVGVFIDPHKTSGVRVDPTASLSSNVSDTESDFHENKKKKQKLAVPRIRPPRHFSSPFIGRVVDYMQRNNVPFEHVDVWVPSFVSQPGSSDDDNGGKCRLCFAGCGTADYYIPPGESALVPLSSEVQFDLISFGEYSQKFSFDVGSGLPGRVYLTGVSSWEQGIQSAPSGQFERKGGAVQWGIQTVLGVPVPSPNVGRVVILFYSLSDRIKDEQIVSRLSEELAKLMPSPKWKLVVDVGLVSSCDSTGDTCKTDSGVRELADLISNQMPDDKNSPLASLLPGFTSLRLLLLKTNRSEREAELLQKALSLFGQYKQSGHSTETIAAMICRDFMQWTRQDNPSISAANPQGASFGYDSSNGNPFLTVQDSQVASFRGGSLYSDESQQSSYMMQLRTQQEQHTSSQFLTLQSRNSHAEVLTQQVMHNNAGIRNGSLAALNNDMAYSVSPSLHALIHSPYLQALEGHSEMQQLNISNHAGAQHHGV